ncbi:uncharacterized protein E0L32_005000 [Thyridium curvatum]|uniref:Uncharacterized protein n=1 Tax=Thyridium curvatum TaxID=1093900 RepID=A0A507BD49_9PEZI|nr:uncharacterized protein E0L32_005000 [Thyridium curvatum]TPX14891.1 hypothetical protein E0L32_005000 [Thyridium curvatum]
MVDMPPNQAPRSIGHDEELPRTVMELCNLIQDAQLQCQERYLPHRQNGGKRFSASTAPAEVVLALRVVHPRIQPGREAAGALIEAGCFFKSLNLKEARSILAKDRAFAFFVKQLSPKEPRTPPQNIILTCDEPTLGQTTGPFATLIGYHDFIKRQKYGEPQERPRVVRPQAPEKPSARRAFGEDGLDRNDSGHDNRAFRGSDEPHAETEAGEVEKRPAPETIVVEFLAGLCGAIAVQLQPTFGIPRYIGVPFEQTFRFGDFGTGSQEYECGVRIDGQLCRHLLDVPKLGSRLCVFFEAKRDRDPPKGRWATYTQQALEHAAIIWARHFDQESGTMALNPVQWTRMTKWIL